VAPSSAGGTLWPLVKAMQLLPCMGSSQDRNFVVRLLADRLGTIQIDESPKPHQHILSIVEVAARRPDGLPALLDIVRELDEGTRYLREVERIIAARTALELWPEEERERLFALLSGMIFKDLVELYRQVAGANAPELPVETSYREVFLTLETLNADPDGLPKPIVFVEHLASGVPSCRSSCDGGLIARRVGWASSPSCRRCVARPRRHHRVRRRTRQPIWCSCCGGSV
jgi:hypothetical protein